MKSENQNACFFWTRLPVDVGPLQRYLWCSIYNFNMNCLLWNIRGLGKGEKCTHNRNFVVTNKVSLMSLVETKHRKSIKCRLRRMWGGDDFDFYESFASIRHAGGIVIVWDQSKFFVSSKHVGERWILLEGHINVVNLDCCVGIVYGSNGR